jgi:hypothetical protein
VAASPVCTTVNGRSVHTRVVHPLTRIVATNIGFLHQRTCTCITNTHTSLRISLKCPVPTPLPSLSSLPLSVCPGCAGATDTIEGLESMLVADAAQFRSLCAELASEIGRVYGEHHSCTQSVSTIVLCGCTLRCPESHEPSAWRERLGSPFRPITRRGALATRSPSLIRSLHAHRSPTHTHHHFFLCIFFVTRRV